ncbi:nitroreductase/quinone reductase family protein [Streptomyces sp. SID13031]|uniref:nitroreductase/quinone reductase family protein n=1 Tax=Streptomyces sp. SID13031 TaxID=2706046 RepID=UPI0013C5483A|nr:nitroreductase/quinone reductase family protein [Streptomyces sp. SID13031]NEA30537.1 nitroreductase family deazaflavin-dependent oxidoreductase [Streptomyces sp. SID13031]
MENTKQQKSSKPGRFSRWMQHRMNARMNTKVRNDRGTFMGMDVLILHTVGRHSGERRESPLAWFADGDSRLIIASGGGNQHPDWFANLISHPDQVAIELPGSKSVPVTADRLEGTDREQAWQLIATAQPRIAKYQAKSERVYPVLRLTPR